MPKAVENKKKSQPKPPKDPLGHQIWFKTKDEGEGLPCVGFKNRSTSQGSEDQSELSPRFASNDIHTTMRLENLQENGVEIKLDVSQAWF